MALRLVREPARVERLRLARDLRVSPRRLHGWEPERTQRGYDRDGNRVPLAQAWEIVTTAEPEWSDEDRSDLIALSRYEAGLCECGWHESLTGDKANHFTFDVKVCPVCSGAQRFARIQGAADQAQRDRLGEDVPPSTPDPADGRHVFTRLMSPAEVESRANQKKT